MTRLHHDGWMKTCDTECLFMRPLPEISFLTRAGAGRECCSKPGALTLAAKSQSSESTLQPEVVLPHRYRSLQSSVYPVHGETRSSAAWHNFCVPAALR